MVINPVLSYILDSRLMEGNTYRERSALGVSLVSGPTEGASCLELLKQSVLSSTLVVRQVEGVTKIVSDCKPVINPVQDITPDGRPMEGSTYPELPALGVSLDSGLRAGMSSIEPTRQSVLNTSSVIRPDETDRPERSALASQMHYEQSCFKSSVRPMPDPDFNDHTDVNEDINTDLPESTALMMNSQMDHERSCLNHVNVDIDTDLLEISAPMMNSDLIVLELEDDIRLEVLRNRTMENMSSHEFNDQLLPSEYVNLNTAELFLDQARSVGQRQWNMYMDLEVQSDTANGVSVYYGGDPYDSEIMEKHRFHRRHSRRSVVSHSHTLGCLHFQ